MYSTLLCTLRTHGRAVKFSLGATLQKVSQNPEFIIKFLAPLEGTPMSVTLYIIYTH